MNFQRAKSKQQATTFFWCPDPITIDKSASWGEGNFQKAPSGAFLKWDEKKERISHLVQPNGTKTSPIGWRKTSVPNVFEKYDVAVLSHILAPALGDLVLSIHTKDGYIRYEIKEDSFLLCNFDNNDKLDLTDCWIISETEFHKNYTFN